MTTTLIDCAKLNNVKRKLKKQITMISVVAVTVLAICAVLCFIATPQNYVWMIVLNSTLSVCGGWFVIYKLFSNVLVLKAYRNLFIKLLAMPQTTVSGVVENVQKKVTVRKNISADVIMFANDSRKYYVVGGCDLSNGTTVVLSVADGFVCKIEVQNGQ